MEKLECELFKRTAGELMLKKCGKTDEIRQDYSHLFFHDLSIIRKANLEEDFWSYTNEILAHMMGLFIKDYIYSETDHNLKNIVRNELREFLGEEMYQNLKY